MAELQEKLKENGSILRKRWKRTVCAVNQYCYDKNRKRYQDVPDRKWYSLHANILAILAGAIPHEQCSSFLADILADKTLIQPSLYFEFYVLSAMQLYAAPEAIRKRFRLWEKMLEPRTYNISGNTGFFMSQFLPCLERSAGLVYPEFKTIAAALGR